MRINLKIPSQGPDREVVFALPFYHVSFICIDTGGIGPTCLDDQSDGIQFTTGRLSLM